MVVSASATSHSAGRAESFPWAGAATAKAARTRAARRKKEFNIDSKSLSMRRVAWRPNRRKLNVHLPHAAASAKAAPTQIRWCIPLEPQLPGPDTDAPSLLGRPWLRHSSALRHGDGRRDLSPCYRTSRIRSEFLESRLRATLPSADRRSLRREPEPIRALLPIPGRVEAEPRQPAGSLSRQPRRDWNRPAEA